SFQGLPERLRSETEPVSSYRLTNCQCYRTQFDFDQYFTLNNSIKKDYLCKHIAASAVKTKLVEIDYSFKEKTDFLVKNKKVAKLNISISHGLIFSCLNHKMYPMLKYNEKLILQSFSFLIFVSLVKLNDN
ncbi:hypothetical protein BpHYR1_031342, partial [Brachionus plicatilis]